MNESFETEKTISNALVSYLDARRMFYQRNNSGALLDRNGRPVKFGSPGSPDFLLCIKGRFVGIEVKGPKGKQRPDQIEYEKRCFASGGIYYVARSIDQAIAFIEDAEGRLEMPKF